MIDLEKLKKLNAERTPGPWKYINNKDMSLSSQIYPILSEHMGYFDETACTFKDWEFIAELANSLPAIIAELEALRKVADVARNEALSFNEEYCNQKDCDRYYAAWEEMQKALSALDEVSDVK